MANVGIQFKDKNGNNVYPCPFPIGYVYISANAINPRQYFGGTWEQIVGKYIMAYDPKSSMPHKALNTVIGNWYTNSHSTVLTEAQMPKHEHVGLYNADHSALRYAGWGETSTHTGTLYEHGQTQWEVLHTGWAGGSQGHTHKMFDYYPVPTLTLNMWIRIA